MNYAEAREQIKSGDVIALSHQGWGSWYDIQVMMVRLGQMSEYTHTGIAWVVGGRVFIIHAIGAGVSITPLSHELPFYWIPVGQWSERAEEFALAKVGKPYSKWQAIKAFFGRLKAGEDDWWQCTEFTAVVLSIAGVDVTLDDLTPTRMVRRLQELGHAVYLVEGDDGQ